MPPSAPGSAPSVSSAPGPSPPWVPEAPAGGWLLPRAPTQSLCPGCCLPTLGHPRGQRMLRSLTPALLFRSRSSRHLLCSRLLLDSQAGFHIVAVAAAAHWPCGAPINCLSSTQVCLVLIRSVVSDSAPPWTVAPQAPLPTGLSRQEHWSGLLCPSPGLSLTQGLNPCLLMPPALAGGFFITNAIWEAEKVKVEC